MSEEMILRKWAKTGLLDGLSDSRQRELARKLEDKLIELTFVSFREIDWTRIYRPYIPLQISSVLLDSTDLDRFPHKCPRCQSPAYIGLMHVDCSRGCDTI